MTCPINGRAGRMGTMADEGRGQGQGWGCARPALLGSRGAGAQPQRPLFPDPPALRSSTAPRAQEDSADLRKCPVQLPPLTARALGGFPAAGGGPSGCTSREDGATPTRRVSAVPAARWRARGPRVVAISAPLNACRVHGRWPRGGPGQHPTLPAASPLGKPPTRGPVAPHRRCVCSGAAGPDSSHATREGASWARTGAGKGGACARGIRRLQQAHLKFRYKNGRRAKR